MSDEQEALVDHLRSGDFDQLLDGSTKMMEKQMEAQMCLQADGSLVRGNPEESCRGWKQQQKIADDPEPELDLDAIRQARIEEMKMQKKMTDHWRSLGHGRYREIDDERSFFKEVAPHERVVCVIHDDDLNPLHEGIRLLAEKHLETAFLRLRIDRAHFMMKMIDLDNLPVMIVLRHGRVVASLDTRQIRGKSVAQLKRLLWSQDALGAGEVSDEDISDRE